MPSSVSVVPIGPKTCKPFLLEVMVFSPESGFKFSVTVERSCTPDAEAVWKLVFDLYKVADGKETQLVHVSFKAEAAVHRAAVQAMVTDGIKPKQAEAIIKKVHPATKAVAGKKKEQVTQAQKETIQEAMSEVLSLETETN